MAKQRLEEIRKIRLEKANKLRELEINPYPSKVRGKRISVSKARESFGKKVGVAGRVWSIREHGSCCFLDIKDETGAIQLFVQSNKDKNNFKILKLLDIGDFLWVEGKVIKTKSREITIDVDDIQLLTKSVRPLPSKWHGLKDVEERYRQRYVDLLLNEDVKEVFKKRSKIVTLLRKYLDDQGFLEVKTPALQPLYGGASAKPFVTHHNSLGIDMYLRIADELYLKRLIVGGFEKVYEICTDFRNEGVDRWHNPEFTMLEFYWAYADYNDLMVMTEEMLSGVVKKVTGDVKVKYGDLEVDFSTPWKRLTYRDAILKYAGIDIDKENSIDKLKKAIKKNKLKVDLKNVTDTPMVLDSIYKATVRTKLTNPVFLIDHPYSMRPLAKRKGNDTTKVESIQLIAAGAELLNAYSELNDPQDQRARWEEDMAREKTGVDETQVVDEDYIRALEYGMPPTTGWGMGIDRFTAILTNQHTIKDTILFPTLRPRVEKRVSKKKEK